MLVNTLGLVSSSAVALPRRGVAAPIGQLLGLSPGQTEGRDE